MVSYCPTALAGGTCTDGPCRKRHDISRCEPCGCSFPASLLGQHRSGKKHLRNVAANGTSNPVAPHLPPPLPSNLPNSRHISPPSAPSPSICSSNPTTHPRVTVSHEDGLDFVVEGTENAGRPSFSPVKHTILIEKTEVMSSLTIPNVTLLPATGTPASCFTVSVPGETSVLRKGKPRRIIVSFQAPCAGTFSMSLEVVFSDKTRQNDREFVVLRELRAQATLPGTPASAGSEGTGVTVSPESGLEFSIERARPDVPFATQTLELVINKSSANPVVSFEGANVRSPDISVASVFSAQLKGESKQITPKRQRTMTVTFSPQKEGEYEADLELTFCDRKRKVNFVVKRTMHGIAKEPINDPRSDWADDYESFSTDEEEELPDGEGTGISVSDEDGVYFGIVERRRPNGPFATPSSSLIIEHAEGFPAVIFVEARIRSLDGGDSGFIASFEGDSTTIYPGSESAVLIIFNPKFEGQFDAMLELIFSRGDRSGRFSVSRRLRAIAGSLEDHKHFEFLDQERYNRRIRTSRQVPPQKVVPLWPSDRPQKPRKLPEYELPPLVRAAMDDATIEDPFDKEIPRLIKELMPGAFNMDTYAQHFKALLNIEDAHQQQEILGQPPFEVDIDNRGSKYSVELHNNDEDLLPEVITGDFLWLDDRQEDIRYEARITNFSVFTVPRGKFTLAVLKIFLQVPASFDLYRGAQFQLRFRLNRMTLRRQYHALASSFASLRRLLFPSASDIKPLRYLSEAEIDKLPLVNQKIRKDDQQLNAVVSILQQPKGSVPFIIFGPPGTGKTSVVVESIIQLLKSDPNFKILVCTPSNAAADLLVERLAAGGLDADQIFRLNAYSRYVDDISEDVQAFSVVQKHAKLLAFRVVLSTCSTAGFLRTENIPAGHFSHIVIDEAAQAEEPLALIPIAAFTNENTNVILAGDPHQLGPVIKSGPVSDAGLGMSYIERLMLMSNIYGLDTQVGTTIVDLQRNRRSHGSIIAWPNRYLYEDKMRAHANPDISHVLLQSDVLRKKGFPVVFRGIKGNERRTRHSPSYYNIDEASLVRDYCQKLTQDKEHKIYEEDIGVIAPYKAQVRTIRELLKVADLKGVSVGSVEQFQGQERKVIIFATTRSNTAVTKQGAMGFLQNRRRMNVAITRAQALLIVLGDPVVLGKDELWRTLLNYVCVRGGWDGKMLTWKPKEEVKVPGYNVIPRPGGVVYGESYVDGKSKEIYRYFSK
ncbi:P-loop containing nucleoside triphosphate hydrolase protein [Lactarius tabidus]